MSYPFLICALPRSRTAWLSNFLTFGQIECAHELTSEISIAGLQNYLTKSALGFSGNADTAQSIIMGKIRAVLPEAPIVVVRREPSAVLVSLARLGMALPASGLDFLVSALEMVQALPNTLTVEFENLDCQKTVQHIQNFVSPGEPFNPIRFNFLRGMNVVVTQARLAEILRNVEKGQVAA